MYVGGNSYVYAKKHSRFIKQDLYLLLAILFKKDCLVLQGTSSTSNKGMGSVLFIKKDSK
jgi:hypothetical protein